MLSKWHIVCGISLYNNREISDGKTIWLKNYSVFSSYTRPARSGTFAVFIYRAIALPGYFNDSGIERVY